MGTLCNRCPAFPLLLAALLIGLAGSPALPALAQQPDSASPPSPTPLTDTPLSLADQQASLGHYADAVTLFRTALAAPQPPVLSDTDALLYATSLAATNDPNDAEQQLTQALAHSPDSAPLNNALGTLIAQSGHLEDALPYFEHAVQSDPSLTTAQYHLGTALLALNQPDAALGPLRLAAQAAPDRFDIQLQLGKALSATHQDAEALTHLHLAVQLRSANTSPDALYALALALQASGDARGSLLIFEAATTAAAPSSTASGSAALTNYALARVQTGDAVDAIPLYQRALALGPDTPDLREDFGVAYLQQSDIDHALEQFRAGLALDPSSAHLHYDLGLALKLKDDLAAAVPEFQRAEQLDPSLPDPAYTLGVIYMQQGRFPDAIKQLKQAAALEPNNGDAWALLGSVLKDSGDSAGAYDALTRAVALEPDQPSLHIQLASLDMEAGKRSRCRRRAQDRRHPQPRREQPPARQLLAQERSRPARSKQDSRCDRPAQQRSAGRTNARRAASIARRRLHPPRPAQQGRRRAQTSSVPHHNQRSNSSRSNEGRAMSHALLRSPATRRHLAATTLLFTGIVLLNSALQTHPAPQVYAAETNASSLTNPDAVCASCHQQIYDRYERTQMARGSGLAINGLIPGSYHHQLSDVDYRVFERDGAAWMTFHRPAPDPRGLLSGEHRLQYFIGSGAQGRTYLYQQDGQWYELPINFYAQRNGWEMAPAFANATRMPAPLPTDPNCLHCHVTDVQPSQITARNAYAGAPFRQGGIGCSACHGNPTQHLAQQGHGPIANPAHFAPMQRDSACIQCHLEGEAVVYRPDRSLAQFVPGDNLADIAVYFVKASQDTGGNRAVSQYEALLHSACKRAVGDKLTCTTCHDPHYDPPPAERVQYFRARCLTCHATPAMATHHPEQPDCAACHMPARNSTDISHNQVTDHDIEIHPPNAQPAQLLDLSSANALVPVGPFPAGDRAFGLAYAQLAERGLPNASEQALHLLTRAAQSGQSDHELEVAPRLSPPDLGRHPDGPRRLRHRAAAGPLRPNRPGQPRRPRRQFRPPA